MEQYHLQNNHGRAADGTYPEKRQQQKIRAPKHNDQQLCIYQSFYISE